MKKLIIGGICLLLAIVIASCENQQGLDYKRYYVAGSLVYQVHCQNCHGAKGEGLAALIPPLTDSVALKNNPLPCVIKNGLQGKITVAGKQFDGNMPAQADLTPIQLAQVVIYVSNSFGNKNGFTTDDQVQSALTSCTASH